MKKNIQDKNGFVFSTNPNFGFVHEEENIETITPKNQKLKIKIETKNRGGKVATVITGFIGKEEDAQELGKKLKSFCGTGGSVKDGEIIVQGDNRDKLLQWLLKNEYTLTKKIG